MCKCAYIHLKDVCPTCLPAFYIVNLKLVMQEIMLENKWH